ncbi:hypothetical protein PR003_g17913 [Phytophthora rubi]|uniref:Uncharacterized protein n=1 Tax=Phytophthora rubi TaxID=129364 RepID=A0A6A3KF08_9STRA|nr:hypothetical protein PR001_g17327 [Phytophthora rubi]KAE9319660.1 hypothetical protein PR003_g17913 [Phytophthora rubi]
MRTPRRCHSAATLREALTVSCSLSAAMAAASAKAYRARNPTTCIVPTILRQV